MTQRRGFTLIELLVALVLLTIVLGAIYKLLNTTQRVSRAQAERIDMQSNMRAGTLIVPAELLSIGFDSVPAAAANGPIVPDLQSIQPNSVQFRAYRSLGIVCQVNTVPNQLVVSTAANYSELRAPVASPRDSLMIYVENDPTTIADDRWVSRPIASVGATTCPGGSAARVFTTAFDAVNDPVPPAQITAGSPLRTFEDMEYSLYQDANGLYYLGARSASDPLATRQPVLGPLSSNGFHLEYYDRDGTQITGNTLTDRRNVRTIRLTLVGVSSQAITSNGYSAQQQAVDSVVTLVQLRNAVHR